MHHAGRVEDILQTYDRERRVLPPPVRLWEWGWPKSAETWNGRIASAPPPTVLWPLQFLFVWDKLQCQDYMITGQVCVMVWCPLSFPLRGRACSKAWMWHVLR